MLQVEKISRASANQRAGRCGRVMSGVCVRLYSEEDYVARPPFSDPEILRSSLASVILRMKALKLGEVEDFPFVEAPSSRAIADGYQLLAELNAVDERAAAHADRRQLAKLPIDPRIARMIVAARDEGCLSEMLIIASGLAMQDPRDRPMEKTEAADTAHAQFADERSEFLGLLTSVGFLRRGAQAQEVQPQARATVPGAFSVLRAAARVARSARPAACAGCRDGLASEREGGHLRAAPSRAAGGSARQHRLQVGRAWRVSRRARHQVLHLSRARRCGRRARPG